MQHKDNKFAMHKQERERQREVKTPRRNKEDHRTAKRTVNNRMLLVVLPFESELSTIQEKFEHINARANNEKTIEHYFLIESKNKYNVIFISPRELNALTLVLTMNPRPQIESTLRFLMLESNLFLTMITPVNFPTS